MTNSITPALKDKRFRAMIVEDNVNFRAALRNLISSRFISLTCEEAGGGKEALRKIDEFLPHIVFMDIKLPGQSGLELSEKIKDSCPRTTIIILTAYDSLEYRQAASQKGVDHFILKGSSTANEILTLLGTILSDLESADAD